MNKELLNLLLEVEKDIKHNISIENYQRIEHLEKQAIRLKEELTLLALIK